MQSTRSFIPATRQAGTSAAIGAAFLLYFGFKVLAEPTGDDLFAWSSWIFYHTLRWGGLALAFAAIWCWTGHAIALVADGIIAAVIGVLLVATGGWDASR